MNILEGLKECLAQVSTVYVLAFMVVATAIIVIVIVILMPHNAVPPGLAPRT